MLQLHSMIAWKNFSSDVDAIVLSVLTLNLNWFQVCELHRLYFDLWMKSSMRRSKTGGKFTVRISHAGRYNISLFWNYSGNQTSNRVTNWKMVQRIFVFFDQLDKSPDSGLAADDSCSNCIRGSFIPPLPTADSRAATFALPRKKERVIAG